MAGAGTKISTDGASVPGLTTTRPRSKQSPSSSLGEDAVAVSPMPDAAGGRRADSKATTSGTAARKSSDRPTTSPSTRHQSVRTESAASKGDGLMRQTVFRLRCRHAPQDVVDDLDRRQPRDPELRAQDDAMGEHRHGHRLDVVRRDEIATVQGRLGPDDALQRQRTTRRDAERHPVVDAGRPHQVDDVLVDRVVDVDLLECGLHREKNVMRHDPRHLGDVLASLAPASQHLLLLLPFGIADGDADQEAVELGFGQRIGAFELDGILRRDDQKRRLEGMRLSLRW